MKERHEYECVLAPEDADWRPPDFPGSDEAAEKGCTCRQNQPKRGSFWFASDCPLHQLEAWKWEH
jgi:hypothetical protein